MDKVSEVNVFHLGWFKDEFGAKKTIEFAPKLKSENGHAKGKIVTSK
jgi:hypothetical protein